MDFEVRIKAIEERVSEVETAHKSEGDALRKIFDFMQHIDANLTTVVTRVGALETNFSLLNAKVDGLDRKVDGLERKVDGLDRKVEGLDRKIDGLERKVDGLDRKVEGLDRKIDVILDLMQRPTGSQSH